MRLFAVKHAGFEDFLVGRNAGEIEQFGVRIVAAPKKAFK